MITSDNPLTPFQMRLRAIQEGRDFLTSEEQEIVNDLSGKAIPESEEYESDEDYDEDDDFGFNF